MGGKELEGPSSQARIDGLIEEHRTYRLVRKLAEGGMGAVYEAVQQGVEGFDKRVAIKTILESYTDNAEFVGMFIGEAKLVADLVHQNIVQVYQLGRWDGGYYIAMEYVDGINLADWVRHHLEAGRALPVELGTFIVSRICRGLQYAHDQLGRDRRPLNIVHRDVSPKNILINFQGVVKLTDFGIAKARLLMKQREGETLLGKVEYMSPEQARFGETDHRSDLFSLGIVLYEVLTGRCIFFSDDVDETLEAVKRKEIPDPRTYRPDIPEKLAEIVMKALERDVLERYQSAGEMGFDLEYYMYHDRFGPTNLALAKYLRELLTESREGGDAQEGTASDGLVRPWAETVRRERE